MKTPLAASIFAGEPTQLYKKACYLETAKGQAEEALEIYNPNWPRPVNL